MEEFASQLQRIKQDDANRDDFIQASLVHCSGRKSVVINS